MRVATGLAIACLAVGALLAPGGAQTNDRWMVIPRAEAGLGGAETSFNAIASNRHALLLGGDRLGDDGIRRAAIWRSEDGVEWDEVAQPEAAGSVTAIATHGSATLAVGGLGPTTFVWRSGDAGRTWRALAEGAEIFGVPAPQMGRSFVGGLLYAGGYWIASGGGSAGYTGVWISRDGSSWQQTLASSAGASGDARVVRRHDGGLFAYGAGDRAWFTNDPTSWSTRSIATPDGYYLRWVAPGATVAIGEQFERHGQSTPILRATNRARAWVADRSFLHTFPNAAAWIVTRVAHHWVAAGYAGEHPGAWITRDLDTWRALPRKLRGTPGGALNLVAAVDSTIVMIGSAPELDRYYVFDATSRPDVLG